MGAGPFGSEDVRMPGDDPIAALEHIAKKHEERGELCSAACVEAAAKELDRLRTQALDPTLGQAAIALLLEDEWDEFFERCPTCRGLAPGKNHANIDLTRECIGHRPSCARGVIVAAARAKVRDPEAIRELVEMFWAVAQATYVRKWQVASEAVVREAFDAGPEETIPAAAQRVVEKGEPGLALDAATALLLPEKPNEALGRAMRILRPFPQPILLNPRAKAPATKTEGPA